MADATTGSNAILRMEAWVTGTNAAGNYNNFHWKLSLIERTSSSFGFSGSVPASIEVFWDGGGYHVPWSGNFAFDFRPGGAQSVVIAEGDLNGMGNFSDGSPRTFTFRGNIGSSGTSTVGGPTSVDQPVAGNITKVAPGTPTGVTATRVSDTQINLGWSQSSASNGQPQNNDLSRSVNGGAWEDNFVVISATTAATVTAAANQKITYRVRGWNPQAGHSAWSAPSAPVYTTPAAPSGVVAAKNASLDIVVSFTKNVAYSEHEHEVNHGVVSGGVTTWDSSPLATLASGVTTYTHTAPNPAQVHVYRVRAKAGSLLSGYATSGSVQLLAAPNAPSLPALPAFADKAAALVLTWTHNPVDSTPQSAYEVEYSTNGGTSWTSTGKVTSTTASRSFAGGTWAADVTVTFRVRTWGQATTGGSDGAGGSPWSSTGATTFKTRPVASIVSPADASVVDRSTVTVALGFTQAEGASFVDATITLLLGATPVETVTTTTLAGTLLTTRVADGGTYTVTAQVRDSHGLVSNTVTATFTVAYLDPVAAVVSIQYLPASGFAQIGLVIDPPTAGEAEAVLVSITRSIGGVVEQVLGAYPVAAEMTILDTTPTIVGENTYVVTTISADGSELDVTEVLVTAEPQRAYLSKGPGLTDVVVFGGDLRVEATPVVDSALVAAAGRSRPIGLYSATGSLVVSGTSTIAAGFGSTPEQIEALLLRPGRACYRDPSGRRIFGLLEGKVSRQNSRRGELSFTISETS